MRHRVDHQLWQDRFLVAEIAAKLVHRRKSLSIRELSLNKGFSKKNFNLNEKLPAENTSYFVSSITLIENVGNKIFVN